MMAHIYLSGPMSGLVDHNFPAFHAAAAQLRALGHQVVNPAELCVGAGSNWAACMRIDIKALCDCDTLALLPGWQYSRGAQVEQTVAFHIGLKIHALQDLIDHPQAAATA